MIIWNHDYKITEALLEKFGSPLYVYDKKVLTNQIEIFNDAFKNFSAPIQNMFAIKALPNPHILKILQEYNMGFDCSSVPEITLAKKIKSDNLIFTGNNVTVGEVKSAIKAGAIINFDSYEFVNKFIRNQKYILDGKKMPELVYCRLNPGDIDLGTDSQLIMGMPTESKFGMTSKQVEKSFSKLRDAGVKKFGLHTMLVTNESNYKYCTVIVKAMFEFAVYLAKTLKIKIDTINLGGGFGVPYHPEDPQFEIKQYANEIQNLYNETGVNKIGTKNNPVKILTENGRWITGESGFLLTKVISKKQTYRNYIGIDATMSNLMRPGMYGAYHFIKVLSNHRDFSAKVRETADIVGSICENNDKFAVQRSLPKTKEGDILIIHTCGAHAFAMGFQYNGRLRSAEVLIDSSNKDIVNTAKLIRRSETENDYFATIVDF
jgi:diaminopimelate decarboxylase